MTDEPTEVQAEQTAPTCYRHADRETYIRCQRCDRPICPDCMRQASVGFQCPDCVAEGRRTVRQARTPFGGTRVENPGVVTKVLVGLNALVFVLIAVTGGNTSTLLYKLWLLPTSVCVQGNRFQCLEVALGVSDGAYWQLLTSTFTHVAIWHIAFNMLALWVLGPQLEMMLGRWRFTALYLLSGLAGSVVVYWLAGENSPTVGASGALFGLMAALLVVAVRVKGDVQSLLGLVAVNVVITVIGAGYISWQGHLGGFVGGLVLSLLLVYAPKQGRTAWQVAGLTAFSAALVAAVVLRTLVLNG